MSNGAVRVDAATSIEERLEHVATPRGLLYSWTARPPQAESCVLVCSSVFGDFVANYHRERLIGRLLAARGHGVVRFHYAGEGNSQGNRRDMTLSTLCDDARAVLDHAKSLGFSKFAVLGTRVGALVAAAIVSDLPPSVPLAVWEPPKDPLRFFAEAQRANRMSRASQGGAENGASNWRQELEKNGVVHLLGYDVYPAMVKSLENVDFLTTLGTQPRKVMLARFASKEGAPDPIRDGLVERGFSVEYGSHGLTESWWFHSERVPEVTGLIGATVEWLTASLSDTP
jgi:pimeloyl-ACP methyl ester carboxylesterase